MARKHAVAALGIPKTTHTNGGECTQKLGKHGPTSDNCDGRQQLWGYTPCASDTPSKPKVEMNQNNQKKTTNAKKGGEKR